MNRTFLSVGVAVGGLAAGALAATVPVAAASEAPTTAGTHTVRACSAHPAPGFASCLAIGLVDANGKATTDPEVGFNAQDVQKAYNLKGLKSHGRTVAIVDAFAYPTLEADLAKFRSNNNLPACTTKNGCLTVIGQDGGKPPKEVNEGWDVEQALDLDMVSAACPDCKILMVESDTNSFKNLGAAVNQAAKSKGVVAVSNSYGGGDGKNRSDYDHKNVAIVASTGDSGFQGGSAPSSFTNVIAVGGTSVFPQGGGYRESAWSGAGSGCSTQNKAPSYQKKTSCGSKDAAADVSGAADPNNGGLIIIYDGQTAQYGGTSESSPLIAAVFGLSGNVKGYPGAILWKNSKKLNDVTSGSNGSCGSPLCSAGKGWDGPTGLGTPNGTGAF